MKLIGKCREKFQKQNVYRLFARLSLVAMILIVAPLLIICTQMIIPLQ